MTEFPVPLLIAIGCCLGVLACRRFASVRLDWGVVLVSAASIATALSRQQSAVAAWSATALLVGFLPVIIRRGNASVALALVAAAWLGHPVLTGLLWYASTAGRRSNLTAIGIFLPLMVLLGATADEANANAFAAVVVLAITMASASIPARESQQSFGGAVLAGMSIAQLRVVTSPESLPDWALGAGVFPAVVMLLLLGGGRGLRAATMDDVLYATRAVVGGIVIVAAVAMAVVPDTSSLWQLAILSAVGTLAAMTAMRPRPLEVGLPETLEFVAGQGPRRPIRMSVFSVLLLSLLTCVPAANGWTWLKACEATLDATRLDPQPGFLLCCLSQVGPVVLGPMILQTLMSIWLGDSRGLSVRFRPMAWAMAVIAIAGPIVASLWLQTRGQ